LALCDLPGICGPYALANCRTMWYSRWGAKIGSYPSDLLPSRRTVWHMDQQVGMEFPPPLPLPVLPGIGSFIFNPLSPLAPPQSLIMNVNSHLTLSFVRAKVRSNYQYIVTEDDVAQAEANDGIVEIDLNNYVMDVVSVCDTPWVLKYALMNELVTLDPTFSIDFQVKIDSLMLSQTRELPNTGLTMPLPNPKAFCVLLVVVVSWALVIGMELVPRLR